jgi:hypothetical protein
VPEAAWINKPKVESNKVMLAEMTQNSGVSGFSPGTDRRSWDILEADFSSQADKTDENDTKFKIEVSQNH